MAFEAIRCSLKGLSQNAMLRWEFNMASNRILDAAPLGRDLTCPRCTGRSIVIVTHEKAGNVS